MNVFFFYFYDESTDATTQVSVDDMNLTNDELEFFYDDKVRKVWHSREEKWYFSIIDVIELLTDSVSPKKYWSKLKTQLFSEGFETSTISRRFRIKAKDGKMRLTDCMDQEQLFRIIQSIPSPKAESFKLWYEKCDNK